jgi:hypothetical protein
LNFLMTSTLQTTPGVVAPMELDDADSPAQVLAYARAERHAALRAEANLLAAAVAWADQHPAESLDVRAACTSWREGCIPIAGEGAPLVAEFAVPELAAALGMSTDSGKRFLGQALELAYRLPKHWARVRSGELPAWRARRLAEATMSLSFEAAQWVDAQLAAFLHATSFAAQDRLVAEAIARFDPARAQEEAEAAEDRRGVRIDTDQVTFWGTCFVTGELDLPDAIDLENAIERGAAHLQRLGSTESLTVRRAQALGAVARGETHLDLDTSPTQEQPPRQRGRQVVLYVHLAEAAIGAATSDCLDLARVENTRSAVTAAKVRDWCGGHLGGPDVQVTVKPVIDLDEHVHTQAYEVPDRLAEQTGLRDHHCVFPWCRRPARGCDRDHVVEHDKGGSTCSCNLAPLCRRHHRLKTHASWSYTPLDPGTYVWTSPHGYAYLVDHTGTTDVTPRERRGRPSPPHAQVPET